MNVIKFDNVFFKYRNSGNILSNISFEIKPNTTTIILGKNGSGKTTLLKLLMNFERPTCGEIYLKKKLIEDYTILEKSKEIAYVGQDIFNQFDFIVEDYLLFGVTNTLTMFQSPKKEHYNKVHSYIKKFDILHLANKKMDEISGGEKQIVMICKAFVQGSNIIVLDEPLSALDFTNQNKVLKLLKEIQSENKTIIFTTHNPNHALYLDSNVLLIDNEKIVLNGKARVDLTIDKLNQVYGDTIGFSKDHTYEEFSIKNNEI